MRKREPLDIYDRKPEGMVDYLRYNGWHFNKKMCEFAVSKMRRKNPTTKSEEKIEAWDKEKVEDLLKKHNVVLENLTGYDHVYICNQGFSDLYKESVPDEQHLALYVKNMVDDIDQADGFIFNGWYANTVRNGIPIPWDDVL